MHPWALLLSLLIQTGPSSPPLEVSWESEWRVAFERARAEQRLVLVDYWASWCEPCLEMERRTFPDARVKQQLKNFVLLKLDVDRVIGGHGVKTLPMYKVFDPWETERLKFMGFQEPDPFARKLAFAAAASGDMLRATRSLKERDSADGHLLLGQAYVQARATGYARDEFEQAGKLANREKNAALAQIAETRIALTWTMEGKAKKALQILEKIVAQPVDAECAAGAWIAIGHTRQWSGDKYGAADAYRRAISVCPESSPLRRDAEDALSVTGRR